MVVVDSSGWIEFFTDGPKASAKVRNLKQPEKIFTPAVVVYEVYKKSNGSEESGWLSCALPRWKRLKSVPLANASLYCQPISVWNILCRWLTLWCSPRQRHMGQN